MTDQPPEFAGRADGRPEGFDINKGVRTPCDACMLEKGRSPLLGYGDAILLGPLESPWNDGIQHVVCIRHARQFHPKLVISDPNDNFLCRNFDGVIWREQGVVNATG